MKRILAIAPHPDDETLGCGGTLLRHRADGNEIHWLIVTTIHEVEGFSSEQVKIRDQVIEAVSKAYNFASVNQLARPTAQLDQLPLGQLIEAMGNVISKIKPHTVYLPFPGDAHTDHAVVFEAAQAGTKWFRYPEIQKIMAYETISETDFGMRPNQLSFRPNSWVDISAQIERKLEIMALYEGETGTFPFPRSGEAIQAQATLRGSQAGAMAAEAFMLIKEII